VSKVSKKTRPNKSITIDALEKGRWHMDYRDLNQKVRKAVKDGYDHITLTNVNGQRFIGAGLTEPVHIEIFGDAGLDLGVFASGPRFTVHGSGEYLLGNTLNNGEIVVYGSSWDITGMGARGGSIFVMGHGGSRIGIHMKEFKDQIPVIVYGGSVKQYCGEYMAGGVIAVLGLDYGGAIKNPKRPVDAENIDPKKIRESNGVDCIVQSDLGAGIHGGVIYVRGEVPDHMLGVYAVKKEFTEEDKKRLEPIVKRYCRLFNTPEELVWSKPFTKIAPFSHRPFGKAYTTTPV